MENIPDLLQIKVSKAKEELPEIARIVVDSINWKELILGMNNKFNSEQIENLSIETELLLCGIINTEDYPKELETRMKISKNEVNLLLSEMDRLIFKKMQEMVEDRIDKEEKISYSNKPLVADPHFLNLPKDIQGAIASSDWKEKVYNMSDKYKINIEQTGILEDITIKILAGSITPSQFENEIKSRIKIPEDKAKELIAEVNDSILKKIKEILVNGKVENDDNLIPLPPYAAKKEDTVPLPPPSYKTEIKETVKEKIEIPKELVINNDHHIVMGINKKVELVDSKADIFTKSNIGNDIYKEHGIEILSDDEVTTNTAIPIIKSENKIEYREELPVIQEIPKIQTPIINNPIKEINIETKKESAEPKLDMFDKSNIIANKLFVKTASESVVTDYSLPKISTEPILNKVQGEAPKVPHDPYHEEI
jgi:hypothetical protein